MELKDITKEAVTIGASATVADVVRTMIAKRTNTLLVCDTQGALIGEVSISDLLDAVVPSYLEGDTVSTQLATEAQFADSVRRAAGTPVTEFMATDLVTIRPNEDLLAVTAAAIAQRRARIPVVDEENRPLGITSRRGLRHILATYLDISEPA